MSHFQVEDMELQTFKERAHHTVRKVNLDSLILEYVLYTIFYMPLNHDDQIS